jgi:Domain of unknown function (DUF4277)
MANSLDHTSLESLEVGAAPVVRHFLDRLQLAPLLARYLPPASRRPEDIPTSVTLCVLVTNLLLARRPLYGLHTWAARCVPEYLGIQPDQVALLGDDRLGRSLDRLYRADRASLLTALVVQAVREFQIDLKQLHNDTTTVTFAGAYRNQPPAEQRDRPPRITFGYNKGMRSWSKTVRARTITQSPSSRRRCDQYGRSSAPGSAALRRPLFLRLPSPCLGVADFPAFAALHPYDPLARLRHHRNAAPLSIWSSLARSSIRQL